jgi:hypothetical protein
LAKQTAPKIPVPKPNFPFERETVIRYDNDSDEATVYTWDVRIHTYLQKAGIEPVEIYTNSNKPVAWLYKVPKKWAVIRRPKKMKKRKESETND